MDNPLNVTTPFTALTVAVPLSVPLDGFVPIATVTDALLVRPDGSVKSVGDRTHECAKQR